MNIKLVKNKAVCIISAFLLFSIAGFAFSEQNGVVETYKNALTPFDDTNVDAVIVPPKNIVQVSEKYQGGEFWVESRKHKIERFKCSQCHNNKEVKTTKAFEMAHGDIMLDHGGKEKPLDCLTCHSKDDRDFLTTKKGDKIDMDHPYQMCGQCHFREKEDWVGGAHGKRIAYWAGKRVVKNCTSCHNPHSPRFEKQWPSTYSTPLK
jgi:formate-dependent nitrite reductase cytochrome c552 subunit